MNGMKVEQELVNQAYLDEITGGDSELLAELVSLFIRDLPQYQQLLFQAVDDNNRLIFNQLAHKFQSSLSALAMLGVSEKLKKMESGEQVFDFSLRIQLTGLFDDINRSLVVLKNQLKSSITNYPD